MSYKQQSLRALHCPLHWEEGLPGYEFGVAFIWLRAHELQTPLIVDFGNK